MFQYRGQVRRVVDGDTLDLRLDLGFYTYKDIRVRLKSVDTAEIYGVAKDSDEYRAGIQHKKFVEDFLFSDDSEWSLVVETEHETGKYGRWLADVHVEGVSLVSALLTEFPEVTR